MACANVWNYEKMVNIFFFNSPYLISNRSQLPENSLQSTLNLGVKFIEWCTEMFFDYIEKQNCRFKFLPIENGP